MAVDIHSAEGRAIRQLIPLSTLPFAKFEDLCGKIKLETAENGQYLFKCGDANNELIYLLDGSVSLQVDELKIETIKSGSTSARFALAHQIPRKVNAVASSQIRFLRLNADIMKSAQAQSNEDTESFMIDDDLEENDDWMTTLLKSPVFRALPPANLQKILMGLNETRYEPGEVIVQQGEPGDYFYVIKKGQCLVSRKPAANAKEIKLAQLADQDTFGEDALISGEPRNVSVTALTAVSLLRLDREKFITLIKEPTLKFVSYADARELVAKGADFIDVREPDEYRRQHLPLSMNVPFFSLRMHVKSLNRQHPIIVACANGKVSSAAAFILLRQKFNALVLEGGLGSVDAEQFKAPSSFAIDDGVETSNLVESGRDSVMQVVHSHPTAEPTAPLDEIARLRQILQQLKTKYNILDAEKKTLEMKYLALAKVAESLKAELDDLKKSGA